jgi:hypothetical protein
MTIPQPKTGKYQVGKNWFFPLLGRKPELGEVIELPEDVAATYMHNEPGLLSPVRQTTQAQPAVARRRPPRRATR